MTSPPTLYAYRANSINQVDRKDLGLKVHVEILGLNPTVRVLFAKDIVLDRVGETVNWVSFDMDRVACDAGRSALDPDHGELSEAKPIMSHYLDFVIAFGALLVLMCVIPALLFRTASAPLSAKIIVPALAVSLGCYAPFAVSKMMGFPVTASMSELPDSAELVAFVAHARRERLERAAPEGVSRRSSRASPETTAANASLIVWASEEI